MKMKKTIEVNGAPFEYEEECISYTNNFAISENDAREILSLTQTLFKEKGISVYIAFGTLLGAIREHALIKGDEDVDVYTDDEEGVLNSLDFFYKRGLRLVRYVKGRLFSFRMNEKSYIDVYVRCPISGFSIWKLYCCNLDGKPTPKKYFTTTEPIRFLGLDCQCPGHPEELVRFWYGKDWRTPVTGHNFFYEVKSHYYWRKVIDSLKYLIQMVTGWPYWRHLVKKQYKNQQDSLKEWKKYRHS